MKNKRLLAIMVTVLGGFAALTALLAVISSFTGGLYEDVHVFELKLKAAAKPLLTTGFTRADTREFSLWLKLPDRQIENKPIELDVSLVGKSGHIDAKFHEDFRFGYVRNSSGKGQYYKLGEYDFEKGYAGAFRYQTKGSWFPPFNGKLVLRKSLATSVPIQSIGFLIMALLLLLVGVGMIRNAR
jgi:hypothetical protein